LAGHSLELFVYFLASDLTGSELAWAVAAGEVAVGAVVHSADLLSGHSFALFSYVKQDWFVRRVDARLVLDRDDLGSIEGRHHAAVSLLIWVRVIMVKLSVDLCSTDFFLVQDERRLLL